jgi:hypothetical protein
MSKRDEYIAKLKKQLDAMDLELDKLGVKAGKAKENAKVKYHVQMKALKASKDKMTAEMNNILDASEDAWEDFQDSTGNALSAIKGGFTKAWAAFKKHDKKKPVTPKKAAPSKSKTPATRATAAKTPAAKPTAAKATKTKTPVRKGPKSKK